MERIKHGAQLADRAVPGRVSAALLRRYRRFINKILLAQ